MSRMMRMRAASLVSAIAPPTVAEKLAAEFAPFAGGWEEARTLVQSLRDEAFAPTVPMGWMEVKISLVLAQESLAHAGVVNPSRQLIESALRNMLALRADGLGWGRIAFMIGRHAR